MENYRYCNHKSYGVGSALMVKYRRKPQECLWMVSFQSTGQKEKYFFLTRDFTSGEEIEFIDEAQATLLFKEGRDNPKKKRTKTVRKKEINLQDLLDSFK